MRRGVLDVVSSALLFFCRLQRLPRRLPKLQNQENKKASQVDKTCKASLDALQDGLEPTTP